MRLGLAAVLSVALIAAVPIGAAAAPGSGASSDGTTTRATVDKSYALVQLNGAPLSTYVKTKPAPGKKIDFNSASVKSYKAQLAALRNDYKQWLQAAAPKAQIVKGYDLSLNAVAVKLNGASLATISNTPMVVHAEYEGLYYPTADAVDPDLTLISAQAAWAAGGGQANAGEGVKVAIIDTGIDITHPCFSDAGYPAQTQLGDKAFTNNKVIVARVFSNKTPSRAYTAEAVQEHGTHVAGTVACNAGTTATVNGVSIPYQISGVAPRALLGNYNIFPGDILNARSEDILNALDAAYMDGMDIDNMSLGGGASGIQDLLTMAVDNLDQANMISAVAAGNSATGNAVPPHLQAPGYYTVESPGSAARALTAGAISVGHFIATPVVAPSGSYAGVPGDFGSLSAALTANLSVVAGTGANGLDTACSALAAGSLTGKIALITRGTCTFSTKLRNAQAAGAVLVLMGNSVDGDPTVMGQDGTANQPTIPGFMLSKADAGLIKADDGASVTVQVAQAYFTSPNSNIMASFSSMGPTDVDYRVKPDVVAPGVNVLSSIPHQFCDTTVDTNGCFAFFQGTSMATPHLAGSAAVVEWMHPDWSAWQVRSAIVNTADQGVVRKTSPISSLETDVNIAGSGREDLANAVAATVAIDPVSVSFGAVPSGAGQAATRTVTIQNLTAATATFDLAVGAGSGGVAYSLPATSITLAAGASGTFAVQMAADKGAVAGGHQAWLTISSGGSQVAHAAVYTFVK